MYPTGGHFARTKVRKRVGGGLHAGTNCERLHEYSAKKLSPEDRIFPICYSMARTTIRRIWKRLDVILTPMISGVIHQPMRVGTGFLWR